MRACPPLCDPDFLILPFLVERWVTVLELHRDWRWVTVMELELSLLSLVICRVLML